MSPYILSYLVLTSAASSNFPKRSFKVATRSSILSIVISTPFIICLTVNFSVSGVKLQISAYRMETLSCLSMNVSLKFEKLNAEKNIRQ